MSWFLKASFFMGDSENIPLGFGREIVKNISILAHLVDIFSLLRDKGEGIEWIFIFILMMAQTERI